MHLSCVSDVISTGVSAFQVYTVDCVHFVLFFFLNPWPLYLQVGCIMCNVDFFIFFINLQRHASVLANFSAVQSMCVSFIDAFLTGRKERNLNKF